MSVIKLPNAVEKHAKVHLLGKTITSVGYMTKEEVEANGWDEAGIIIGLDDGTFIYPLCDEEGNRPGVLDTTNEKLGMIGRIRL